MLLMFGPGEYLRDTAYTPPGYMRFFWRPTDSYCAGVLVLLTGKAMDSLFLVVPSVSSVIAHWSQRSQDKF